MHHAVRVYHQSRIRGLPITTEEVLSVFEQAWSSEGFLSREHEDLRMAEGRKVVKRFVEQQESTKQPLAVEREFRFKLGATTVSGRWDRIDERDGGIVLVDYKTADVEGSDEAMKRARDDARNGQLGLYALAYKEMHDVIPAAVELHFLQSEQVGSAAVKADHLSRAVERVHEAAQGIRGREFPARPSGLKCGTCAFARVCPSSVTRGGS
jgi:DNA helicase-2/ATP-dependent DNA helicase PcrA